MNSEEAAAGLVHLTSCTPGWTEDNVAAYLRQCMRFPNAPAFVSAMEKLALRWSKPTRPLPYDITTAYHAEVEQMELDELYAITEGSSASTYPDFEDGVKIAWEAYQDECARQGKEPNRMYFERWLPAG